MAIYTSTSGNDVIGNPTEGSPDYNGAGDIFIQSGEGGTDTFNGGLGNDIARFTEQWSAYTFTKTGETQYTVVHRTTGQTTILNDFQRVQFPNPSTGAPGAAILLEEAVNSTPIASPTTNGADTVREAGTGITGDSSAAGNVLFFAGDDDINSGFNDSLSVTGANAASQSEQPVTGSVVLNGLYGTLTINANGSWSYALENTRALTEGLQTGQTGQDVFNYRVSDIHGANVTSTLTINVAGTNDAAVITGDSTGELTENTATVSGDLLSADVDNTADAWTPSTVNGSYGSFALGADGNWTYTLDGNREEVNALDEAETLTDSFTAYAVDGTPQVVTVTITGINDRPTVSVDSVSTTYVDSEFDDTFASYTGTIGATDPEPGDTITYGIDGGAASTVRPGSVELTSDYGTLFVNTGTGAYEFVPNDGAIEGLKADETVSFTMTASDGGLPATTQTLTITLDGANDTPALTGAQATLANGAEDQADYTFTAAQLLQGFGDRDDAVLTLGTVTANHGTVTEAAGLYTYVPEANYNGPVELSYTVIDGSDASTPATLSFTLTAVNDAPALTGTPATLAATEINIAKEVTLAELTAGYTDVDGDTLTVESVTATFTAPGGGIQSLTFNVTGGSVVIDLPDYVRGEVELSYDVIDGNDGIVPATLEYDIGGPIHVFAGQQNLADAVAAASADVADTIYLHNGTHTVTGQINLDKAITIDGESQAGTIVSTSALAGYGIEVTADHVSLSDFTFAAPGTSTASSNYGIKAQAANAADRLEDFSIANLTVKGFGGSEVDLNGVVGASIVNLTADGMGTKGLGLAITDSADVTIENLATANNAWGSVALYPTNTYTIQQIDDIVFTGTYSSTGEAFGIFSEKSAPDAKALGDITFPPSFTSDGDDAWTVTNDSFRADGKSAGFTFYFADEASAVAFAKTLNAGTLPGHVANDDSVVRSPAGAIHVSEGLSIQEAIDQAAVGATITIHAGNYTDAVEITKSVNIEGANAGVAGNGDRGAESVLTGGFEILADNVSIDGMTIAGGRVDYGFQRTGVFIDGARDNVSIANNIISLAPGATESDRMGILTTYGADTDGLVVSDNVISGWKQGVYLNPGAEGAEISNNSFADNGNHILAEGPDGLTVASNDFGASTGSQIAVGAGAAVVDVEAELGLGQGATANTFNTVTTPISIFANGGDGQQILGTSGADKFWGDADDTVFDGRGGDDTFIGGTGAETFTGGEGNDSIDGGAGIDTAIYDEVATFEVVGGKWQVTTSGDGADTLNGVEIVDDAGAGRTLLVGAGGFATIQEAIDAADAGDTILIAAGTYNGNVTVNEAVTILGANHGVDGTGDRDAETVINGAVVVTSAATIDGVEFRNSSASNTYFEALRIHGDIDVTVTNSVFYSAGPNGTNEDRAIFLDTTVQGKITITDNAFTGAQAGDANKFGTANWHRGIWSDGSAEQLVINGNSFNNIRSAMNLDGYDDATHTVSNNVISDSTSGISIGIPKTETFAGINNNTFTDVGSDFNFSGTTPTSVTLDLGATNNVGGGAGAEAMMVVLGGLAGDTLSGTDGADYLDARSALDNRADSASNTLDGKAGDDILVGSLGGDTLIGGAGEDTLNGGAGDDSLTGGADNDAIDGGDGIDTASYGGTATLSVASGQWQAASAGEGTDSLTSVEIIDDAGAGRVLLVGAGGFTSIQAAVAAAGEGDTIRVAAGEYNGNFAIDVDNLTIIADEGAVLVGDFYALNGITPGAELADWLKTAPSYTGQYTAAITVNADNVSISGLKITQAGQAIAIGTDAGGVSGLTLTDVDLASNYTGINKGAGNLATNFTMTGGTISDGLLGMNIEQSNTEVGEFDGVTIDGVSFSNLLRKGIYAEAMSHADLTDLTMSQVGAYGAIPTNGPLGHGGNGINLNLKFATFEDITIDGFDFDDVGTSNGAGASHPNGGAIFIAVRDDGATYGANPAQYNGAIQIKNGAIDGTSTGVFAGEPGKANVVNVEVTDVTISNAVHNALHGDVANEGTGTLTFNGSSSVDVVVASGNSDGALVLNGGADADALTGGQGADSLSGGLGEDTLNGGAGNDSLTGGADDDTLDGGAGLDTANYAGAANVTLAGQWQVTSAGEGTDTVTGVEIVDGAEAGRVLLVGAGGFGTIQAAVDAAQDGDTILIADGTYIEQVIVDGVDDLTIREAAGANVTIQAPADVVQTATSGSGRPINSVVTVLNSANVQIFGVTVDGAGAAGTVDGANGNFTGVMYRNASGGLDGVDITGVRDPYAGTLPNGDPIVSGMQRGVGLQVDNDAPAAGDPLLGFYMHGGSISDFQKNATVFNRAHLDIDQVAITGGGAQTINAQNGIQVLNSTGSITGNTITDIGYAGPADAYSGIILAYGNTDLDITGNTITGSNDDNPAAKVVGIFVLDFGVPNSGGEISGNTISHVDEGIDVSGAMGPQAVVVGANDVSDIDLTDPYAAGLAYAPNTNLDLTIGGTDLQDYLAGDAGEDVISGNGGDDTLVGNGGDDTLIGGDGTGDRAIFSGNWADYDITQAPDGTFTIVGPDGTDTVSGVELFDFANVQGVAAAAILNDAPVADDDAGALGNVLAGDTDADTPLGDQLSVTNVDVGVVIAPGTAVDADGVEVEGLYGTLTIYSNGTYSYAVNPASEAFIALGEGVQADDVFTYEVSDLGGLTDTARITVTVQGENEEPIAVNDGGPGQAILATEGETLVVSAASGVLANDTDADDGDQLIVTSLNQEVFPEGETSHTVDGQYGTLTLNRDGSYSYEANNRLGDGDTAQDVFTYTVSDQKGGTDAYHIDFEDYATGPLADGEGGWKISGGYDQQIVDNGGEKSLSLTRQVASGSFGDQLYSPGLGQTAGENGVTGSFEASFTLTALALQPGSEGSYLGVSMDMGEGARGTLLRLETDAAGQWHLVVFDYDGPTFSGVDLGIIDPNEPIKIGFTHQFVDGVGIDGKGNDISTVYLNDVAVHTGKGWEDYFRSYEPDQSPVTYDRLLFRASGSAAAGDQGVLIDNVSVTTNQQAQLTIDVTGADDTPVITGNAFGDVTEDTDLGASGTLTAIDADDGEDGFQPDADTSTYGSWSINAAGEWAYTLNNGLAAVQALGIGDAPLVDSFDVLTTDGTVQTVAITINPTNDMPTITVDATGGVTEDGVLTATGAISVADTDTSDNLTVSEESISTVWSGGTLSAADKAAYEDGFSVGNDGWTYSIDNSLANALNQGETVTLTYKVTVQDDSGAANDSASETVTIVVTGTNDAPVITGGDQAGAAIETGSLDGILSADTRAGATLETAQNYDAKIAALFTEHAESVEHAVDMAAVLADLVAETDIGSTAQAIATVWDYLDDQYSYYVDAVNIPQALLSIEYAKYLQDGGAPLTGVSSKYAPDNADPDSIPQRLQGLHDNLLGNLNDLGLTDKLLGAAEGHTPNPTAYDHIVDLVEANDLGVLLTRPVFGGYQGETNASLAIDLANGFLQPDASGEFEANDADATAVLAWSGSTTDEYGTFTVDQDGKWTFVLNQVSPAVQALNAGDDPVERTYVVTVTDDNGDVDTREVTITIQGANDAAILSSAVANLVETNTELTVEGDLSIRDIDNPAEFVEETVAGTYGSLEIEANGHWTFTAADAHDDFVEGVPYTDTFTVRAADGTTTTVTINILGTNDDPVITSDAQTGSVAEDGVLTASGQVTATDIDSLTLAYSTDGTGAYGSLALDAGTGAWTYTLDNATHQDLAEGQVVTDTFTVTVTDEQGGSTTQDVVITITGENDTPELTVTPSGIVTEDGVSTAAGTVTVSDIDTGDDVTVSHALTGASWTGGSLTPTQEAALAAAFSVDGDSWDYALDNAEVNFLGAGESITLTFAVSATDDSGATNDTAAQTVTVTINGTNDAPVLTVAAAGSLTEDAAPTLTTSGSLSATDADANDAVTVTSGLTTAAWSGGTLTAGQQAALAAGFTTDADSWDYSVANTAVDFLGAGETLTLSFQVTATDDSGEADAATSETVTITITGNNDAPTIGAGVNGVTYDEPEDNYASSGDLPPLTGSLAVGDIDANAIVTGQIVTGPVVSLVGTTASTNSYNNAVAALTQNGLLTFTSTSTDGGSSTIDWTYDAGAVNLDFLNEDNQLVVTYTVQAVDDTGAVSGSPQTITITIDGTDEFVDGDADDNSPLAGGAANDVIDGGAGDDTLSGASGNDELIGGTGDDLLSGGSGRDTLYGGDGDDMINAGSDNDIIYGGAGNDSIEGGSGTDTVVYGDWADYNISRFNNVVFVEDRATGEMDTLTNVEQLSFNGVLVAPSLAVNDAPVADDDAASIDEDGVSVDGTVLGNDTDADLALGLGEAITVSAVSPLSGSYGDLTLNADGSFSYALNSAATAVQALNVGQTLTETFTYTVTDVHGATDTAQLAITITGGNDAPTVAAEIADQAGAEGAPFSFTVPAGTFADVDNASLTLTATLADGSALPSWLAFAGGTFSGTPDDTAAGTYQVRVTASDGSASTSDVFAIAIASTNAAPTGAPTAALAAGEEDQSYTVSAADLLLGFSDPDGDVLGVSDLTASSGTVTDNGDGTYTIGAPANVNGAVTLSYNVVDGNGGSIAANQTFTRAAVDDAPTVAAEIADQAGAEGAPFSFTVPAGTFADIDSPSLALTATLADGSPLPSWLSFAGGTFSGTPGFADAASYEVRVTASDGSESTSDVFTIAIGNTNQAPTGAPTAVLADGAEDVSYTVSADDLLLGFGDADGDTLSVAGLGSSSGTVTDNGDGTYTIGAPANANGTVTLSYDVVDGNGGTIAAQQSFTRASINDDPTGTATAALADGTEDQAYIVSKADLLQGFSDVDGDTLGVDGLASSSGSVADNGDGTYTVTPAPNANGPVTLTYAVVDGNGGSIAASQSFTLVAQNDAPTGTADAVLELGAEDEVYIVSAADLLQGFTDADGDTLTIGDLAASSGVVSDLGDGTYAVGAPANANGAVTLTYTVNDGNGGSIAAQQTFTRAAVNDAPVLASALADQAAQAGTPFTYQVPAGSFTDIDGDTLALSATLADGSPLPAWLSFSAATGTFTGTPPSGGTVQVRVMASDGTLAADDVFDIAVTVANVAPDITSNGGGASAGISVLEGTTAVTDVDALDSDGPGAVVYSLAGGADAGKFTINAATGVLSFVSAPAWASPTDAGANNVYDVIVRASDGTAFDDQALAVTVLRQQQSVSLTLTGGADTFTAPLNDHYTIDALAGNDTITTLEGNDTIRGGAGADVINAGDGDDVFTYLGATDGIDTLNGGGGFDTIRALGANTSISYGNWTGIEAIDGAGFADVRIVGTTAADVIDLSAYAVTGIAAIEGGHRADTITGSAGDDTINGGAGTDTLYGGDGNDVFLASYSLDDDTIVGGAGTDTVRATAANIGIRFASITGVEVFDAAGLANVRLSGGDGADIIDVSGKTLLGGMGLSGGDDNDVIIGSSASEFIIGGGGADTLTGGAGDDVFRFQFLAESRGSRCDTITDFTVGQDKIDLVAIDADGNTGNGDNAFAFIDTAEFSGAKGELRYVASAAETHVYVDVNGDKVADIDIVLTGNHILSGTDFLL